MNETEALARRAAQGAGRSWGVAEDAAMATRWLCAANLPGLELLAGLLEKSDQVTEADFSPVSTTGAWRGGGGMLCPVLAGAAFSDSATTRSVRAAVVMNHVLYPAFVMPFVGRTASRLECWPTVEWNTIEVSTNGGVIIIDGNRDDLNAASAARLCCVANDDLISMDASSKRQRVDPECWATLSHYAHRMYAPATEQSRLYGAGSTQTHEQC